ncbi:MAG: methylated-DNA--[protein]-cysteine S-methyltransferase [Flavobacteriales bacterium]|nr:methylated-DNA--[protein]-cysteine S-methyltransferase [Flavobacteriales bacterium]
MSTIYFETVETPIGSMHLAITSKGIAMFEYPIEERLQTHRKMLLDKHQETDICPEKEVEEVKKQVDNYFNGTRKHFDLPLDLYGTSFQCEVWRSLQKIPFGKTMSYLELATSMNQPKSVRAVAQANGQNHIAIIVPCHRIVGSSGKLTGYSGELWRKEKLLSLERGQEMLPF